MPQEAWSAKRERQYKHIKEGLEDQGRSEDTAEEIAAMAAYLASDESASVIGACMIVDGGVTAR